MPLSRNARQELLIHAVAILATVAGLAYLIWRVGWTLNYQALWLALPLLAAEFHGYLTYLGYMFMVWNCDPLPDPGEFPGASVDFFIPTYNEPFNVLAPTVAGAVAIRYPHRTFVLDDGRRPWVRRLCAQFGAEYLTRDDNRGAKAGNINAALSQTEGEFVAIVDADFVPAPDYIDSLIGYFNDDRVAIVQGPQEFYNRDSFQHLEGDESGWHEQSVFFSTIQPGKNHSNAAFWCGCPSLLRRSALVEVGGVAEETVTEDLHTTIKLHSAGWKSIYHPGVVALGLAPNDYDGFIMQRLRWAEGTMQVIRRSWNTPNLTFAQRVNYLSSSGTYFDAVRKAVFLGIVPLVILSDRLPISASMSVFLPVWAGQFLLSSLANYLLGRGHNRPLMTEFFDSLKMFAFIRASVTLITGKRGKFSVTPKGQPGERRMHQLLMPFVGLIGVYVVSIVIGAMRLLSVGLTTRNSSAMSAAIIWALVIAIFMAEVTAYGYRKVSRRHSDRIRLTLGMRYKIPGRDFETAVAFDLTTSGASFIVEAPIPRGVSLLLQFESEGIATEATVRRAIPVDGGYLIGVELAPSHYVKSQIARLLARSLFTIAGAEGVPAHTLERSDESASVMKAA